MRPNRWIAILASVLLLARACPAGEIHDAVRRNDLKLIAKLLAGSPKLVDARSENREQPLHMAVRWATPEIVAYLIEQGADVNATCDNRSTPLHLTNDVEIARILLDNGADLWARDSSGQTALGKAVDERNQEIIDLLVAAGGGELDFESLIKLGRTEDAAAKLEDNPLLAASPCHALFIAAGNGNAEILGLLLEYGADADQEVPAINASGRYTPLASAVSHAHFEVSRLLLEHGARPAVAGPKNYLSGLDYVLTALSPRYKNLK
jgi:ankyrin repeat protein